MESVAVSIGIGLVVSLMFTEAFGLNVGGMIVPGYLAMYFHEPTTIALTLAAALVTWGLVRRLNDWTILFGRRRVVATMVIGFAVASVFRVGLGWLNATSASGIDPAQTQALMLSATVIGFVIPGLIALWIERTGIIETLSPLLVASSLVRLVLIFFGIETVG